MLQTGTDGGQVGEKLIFLSSVSPIPIVRLGCQGFHLGQHLQVDCVALPVDLVLFDKPDNPAVRLFSVFAVPESAGFLAGFFKTGKIGRQLFGRDVDHAEVIEAG